MKYKLTSRPASRAAIKTKVDEKGCEPSLVSRLDVKPAETDIKTAEHTTFHNGNCSVSKKNAILVRLLKMEDVPVMGAKQDFWGGSSLPPAEYQHRVVNLVVHMLQIHPPIGRMENLVLSLSFLGFRALRRWGGTRAASYRTTTT